MNLKSIATLALSGLFSIAVILPGNTAKPLAPAQLRVEASNMSNYSAGSDLQIGVPLITYRGGSATASSNAYGLKRLTLMENSSVTIREGGQAAYGGRTLKLDLKGVGRLETRYLISRSSAVTVCIYNKGCVELRSSAMLKPLDGGKYVIALIEGKGKAQDVLEQSKAVTLLPNQYTIMDVDGSFSPAKSVLSEKGYVTKQYTRTLQIVEAQEGYSLPYHNKKLQSVILPIGTPIRVVSPFME